MTIFEQINEDIKSAMKSKEAEKLEALRAVKSQLLLLKTSEGGNGEVSDEQAIQAIQKLVKQRKESADIYKTQGRDDLYQIEMGEMAVIEPYLPQQMSRFEIEGFIQELIGRIGATGMADMGRVMGMANKELAGQADGKTVSEVVKQLLA